jgi:hypothetical protein
MGLTTPHCKNVKCYEMFQSTSEIRIANGLFENVPKYKYLGTTLTNQNDIHDEIKKHVKFRECLLSFSQKTLVFQPDIKKLKPKIYKTIILPFVLYECEIWSLTLREEHCLWAFENSVLRKIFRPKMEEDRSWRRLHNDEFHSLYSPPDIVKVIISRRMRWWVMEYTWGRGEVFTGFWLGDLKEETTEKT